MTKQQEILHRINILLVQIAEAIEDGAVEMGWARKSSDEIEELINKLNEQETNDQTR